MKIVTDPCHTSSPYISLKHSNETVERAETGLEIVLTKICPGGRVFEMTTHNDE